MSNDTQGDTLHDGVQCSVWQLLHHPTAATESSHCLDATHLMGMEEWKRKGRIEEKEEEKKYNYNS